MSYAPFLEYPSFGAAQWQEAIADMDPSGQDVFTNKTASSTLQIVIAAPSSGDLAPYLRTARNFILGYSYADATSPYLLHRVPPQSHPIWGIQLRADQVAFTKFAPRGNTSNTNNAPYRETTLPARDIKKYSNYGYAHATVTFGPRPYLMYDDTSTAWISLGSKEYDRYCERYDIDPSLEVLQAETDRSIQWIDGAGPGPSTPRLMFPGAVGEYLSKCIFSLKWNEVPENYVFNASSIPAKILACIGCVNKYDFLGFTAGTLLLQAVKFQKFMFPFYSSDGRAFHYDITFPFQYFNPTLGPSATILEYGHNLFPQRLGGSNGGPGWYAARRVREASDTAGVGDPTYLPKADFATMFDHVLKP